MGNPHPVTMLDLANEILQLTKSHSGVIHKSLPFDDPKQREPYIKRANELLGWFPAYSRNDGLTRTIDYFKRILAESPYTENLGKDSLN